MTEATAVPWVRANGLDVTVHGVLSVMVVLDSSGGFRVNLAVDDRDSDAFTRQAGGVQLVEAVVGDVRLIRCRDRVRRPRRAGG